MRLRSITGGTYRISQCYSRKSFDNGATWVTDPVYTCYASRAQSMTDENHNSPDQNWDKLKGVFNVGGPMTSVKRWTEASVNPGPYKATLAWPVNKAIQEVFGLRVPSILFGDFSGQYPAIPPAPSQNDLNGWGTTGVNRTIPTSPMWSAAQFIGELHEGLPGLPLKGLIKERSAREVGGEYLNVQFGILPTISDLSDAKDAYLGAAERLRSLEANSGRKVKRRIELLNESSTTSSTSTDTLYPSFEPGWPGGPAKNSVQVVTTTTSSRRVWFSGCYTYYYQSPTNLLARGWSNLEKIYGIQPSPSTVWELTPWSWLIDWHANVGEILENLTLFAKDGLIMRWGYLMCHQLVKKEISWQGNSVTLFSERKIRIPGNPLGFATDLPVYTTRQKAILAALGIARGPDVRF